LQDPQSDTHGEADCLRLESLQPLDLVALQCRAAGSCAKQFAVLHKMLLDTGRGDPVFRSLITRQGSERLLR
jgi:hypothetical protein